MAEFRGTATRRPELRVRARGPCAAAARRPRPVGVAHRAQRRRAGRPRRGRRFVEAGARARSRAGRGVPGVRHGRGDARGHVPRARHGPGRRHRRRPRARDRLVRGAGRADEHGTRARSRGSAGPSPACEIRDRATPAPARAMRDREVGELEIRGTSVTPGYYAAPKRPPRRSTTAGCAPATSPTSSTASSSCAAASRTSSSSAAATCTRRTSSARSPTSTACAPATSSRSAREGRAAQGGARRRRRSERRRRSRRHARTRSPSACATPSASRRRSRARAAGHAAEDVVGQAATRACAASATSSRLTPSARGSSGSRRRARVARRPQQMLDAALHRVELEPVEERRSRASSTPAAQLRVELVQSAHAAARDGLAAEVPDHGAHLPLRVERRRRGRCRTRAVVRQQAVAALAVGVVDHDVEQRPCGGTRRRGLEQREVVLFGIVLDEPLHHADAGRPSRSTVSGTMSQPSASDTSYAATSR